MDETISAFVAAVANSQNFQPQLAEINSWFDSGRIDLLAGVFQALEERGPTPGTRPVEATCDVIERGLAFVPTEAAADEFLKIAVRPRIRTVQGPREQSRRVLKLALLFASGHDAAGIARLLATHDRDAAHEDFCVALAAEAVIRGKTAGHEVLVETIWRKMKKAGNPFASLPSVLLPMETGVKPREHSRHGGSGSCVGPTMLDYPVLSEAEASALPTIAVERISDATREDLIKAAPSNWSVDSNGRLDAGAWTFTETAGAAPLNRADLLSLKLDALESTDAGKVYMRPMSPAEAFEKLFSAAENGGAYNSGTGAAWGRVHAWRSVAGLLGRADLSAFDELAREAATAEWYWFEAQNEWFQQVAWDMGLVAVRRERKSLAVLAATDLD